MSDKVEEVEGLRTLTVKQLAAETGIHPWRLRELVKDGGGPPHFRVGRVFRFRVCDVETWMQQQITNQQQIVNRREKV